MVGGAGMSCNRNPSTRTRRSISSLVSLRYAARLVNRSLPVSTPGCLSRPSAGAWATSAPKPPSCPLLDDKVADAELRAARRRRDPASSLNGPRPEQAQRNRVYLHPKFRVRIKLAARAMLVSSEAGVHRVGFDDDDAVTAKSVIIATGARYNRLPLVRLAEFEGVGVYYAATQMEEQWFGSHDRWAGHRVSDGLRCPGRPRSRPAPTVPSRATPPSPTRAGKAGSSPATTPPPSSMSWKMALASASASPSPPRTGTARGSRGSR